MKAARTIERRVPSAGAEVAEQLRVTANSLEEAVNILRMSWPVTANRLMRQVRRARAALAKAG